MEKKERRKKKASKKERKKDFEWLSEIFNDTKHRAVYLRQLSFLSVVILVAVL